MTNRVRSINTLPREIHCCGSIKRGVAAWIRDPEGDWQRFVQLPTIVGSPTQGVDPVVVEMGNGIHVAICLLDNDYQLEKALAFRMSKQCSDEIRSAFAD